MKASLLPSHYFVEDNSKREGKRGEEIRSDLGRRCCIVREERKKASKVRTENEVGWEESPWGDTGLSGVSWPHPASPSSMPMSICLWYGWRRCDGTSLPHLLLPLSLLESLIMRNTTAFRSDEGGFADMSSARTVSELQHCLLHTWPASRIGKEEDWCNRKHTTAFSPVVQRPLFFPESMPLQKQVAVPA